MILPYEDEEEMMLREHCQQADIDRMYERVIPESARWHMRHKPYGTSKGGGTDGQAGK